MAKRSMNRSSCIPGSGKVPAESRGFAWRTTKTVGKGKDSAIQRHLAITHRFKECGLCAWRCAVYFIRQEVHL